MDGWKKRPNYTSLPDIHCNFKDTDGSKWRDGKGHATQVETTRMGVAVLTADKLEFKPKLWQDKKGHYIMIKGSIHWEDTTILNTYVCTQHQNT